MMANDDFDAYVVEEPKRTRRGTLKYQPPDADWSLDRLSEIQDYFQSTYKRPLPLTVKGQGSIHNKLGYDHRSSADISLHPATEEGRSLIAELQRRKIPFLAFEGAVPGASTGPHIHVGRPSSRITNKYPIGSQVKKARKQTANDLDAYTVDSDDFDKYVVDGASATSQLKAPAKPAAPKPTGPLTLKTRPAFGTPLPTEDVRAGVGNFERRTLASAVDEYERARTGSSNIGELRRADEREMAAYRQTESEVRQERKLRRGLGGQAYSPLTEGMRMLSGKLPQSTAGINAVYDYLTTKQEDEAAIRQETDRRMQAGHAENSRLREIADQFTDEDKRQLAAAVTRMRSMGAVSRGLETGSQRVGSGLLYKLAALTDLAGGPGTPAHPNYLGDYLRRQAARGEIAVSEIETDLPPPMRQQLADFIAHSLGALPEIAGAVAVGGPIGGFAALGGLEAGGRKLPFSEVARETAKGAVIGGVFAGAGAVESGLAQRTFAQRAADTARSGLAIGLGTAATEKVFGATDEEALRAAATNVVFHVGMRVPGEVGRLAQAAEAAYKTPPPEGGTPTVGPELQERLSRTETPTQTPASLATEPVSPAEPSTRPPTSATPTAEPPAALQAAVPSLERRGPVRIKDADWLELTPEERARVRQEVDLEQQAGVLPTEEPVTRRPLSELLAERADVGPTEPSAINLLTGKPVKRAGNEGGWVSIDEIAKAITKIKDTAATKGKDRALQYVLRRPSGEELVVDMRVDRQGVAHPMIGPAMKLDDGTIMADVTGLSQLKLGVDTLLALKRFLQQTHPEIKRVEFDRAGSTGTDKGLFEVGRKRNLAVTPRTVSEPRLKPAPHAVDLEAVRSQLAQRGFEAREVEGAPIPTFSVTRGGREVAKFASATRERALEQLDNYAQRGEGEGGYIDLAEIREGLKAGKVQLDDALERVRQEFKSLGADQQRALLARKEDPVIGVVDQHGVESRPDPARSLVHTVFLDRFRQNPHTEGWRYDPTSRTVYWTDPSYAKDPSLEARTQVVDYLAKRGLKVEEHSTIAQYDSRKLWEREVVHHAAQQPRTDTGQFSPGAPGGPEADRSLLRSEARRYGQRYKALDLHQARREGLDIVNDDVARNYFGQLHRIASEFLPEQAKAVDRAETLYNQGKYGQATMLAESVFRSLPDKVNEYAGADAAMQLVERGLTPKANWSKVLQEVRTRLQRTGGLSGGGSTFYDVNKHPEGGRPDHAKIAYILEPVVEALKADASRLIAEGKLKAADYVAHVRSEVNKMLQGEEFADWHPLNKSAALGVLVDKLRGDGPPPANKPPTTEAQPPQQRSRSLPKTLERSGRDPGTNLTHDRLPNAQVNERVEARLASEGADVLETWYRNAPESADRTAAHRVLVDHYVAESVRLADTAPRKAEELYARSIELDNIEAERATTMGQAQQMYSNLLKYNPAGMIREIARFERSGEKVPAGMRKKLLESAQEHKQLDQKVKQLERELVEAEGAEAGGRPPSAKEGGEAPKPRQYRPRTDTVVDSKTEKIRRKLDEAAKRRRAAKAAIAAQLRALESQRTVPGYIKRVSNITRGLMVSSFATAMRNLQTQALRFDVERLTDTVEHTLRRTVGLDSDLSYRNIWRNAVRQFRPGQTREAKDLLMGHEGEYQRMFNTYAGGVEVPIRGNVRNNIERVFQTVERGVEIANIFNRIQEHHVRSAEFLAELDLHLRKDHNQTLEQFVSRNGIDAIPLDTVRKAVDKALEVTFAGMPTTEGVGGRLITSMVEIGNYIPPTVSPVAFPRFMYNNAKFLYQHSPFGMLDLARKNQNKPRVIARSLVGTSLLLLAWQFRNSDHAGEKWYELKIGDTTLDARPFGPFSTYLFVAEAVRRAMAGEQQFTKDEITQVVGASPLGSGAGLELVDRLYTQISNGQWDKLQRTLKAEGGEWGRALLTPVRQVKDLIAAFDASQAVTRDTSSEPFLGPLKESIPYASTDLPEAHLPTTATPIHQERPATKALSGWRVVSPKTFLQRKLDELNFASREILPATGVPAIDSLQKRLMGPLMDELSRELENDAEFKAMSKKAQGAYLREVMADIREEVRAQAEEEQPELYEQLREERKPRRQRRHEEELNSPGLSKAIDLGVPMPIPPRRPDEDDIAYRARLLQVGRQRRARLDRAINPALGVGQQRATLHSALYS